jgi:hypothetical protein
MLGPGVSCPPPVGRRTALRPTLKEIAACSFIYLQSECAGHRERDGSSFVFADGFAPAGVDLHLGGERGAVPGQYVMIRSMIEQPKGIREFREGDGIAIAESNCGRP